MTSFEVKWTIGASDDKTLTFSFYLHTAHASLIADIVSKYFAAGVVLALIVTSDNCFALVYWPKSSLYTYSFVTLNFDHFDQVQGELHSTAFS